jgi:hypothetical protein
LRDRATAALEIVGFGDRWRCDQLELLLGVVAQPMGSLLNKEQAIIKSAINQRSRNNQRSHNDPIPAMVRSISRRFRPAN